MSREPIVIGSTNPAKIQQILQAVPTDVRHYLVTDNRIADIVVLESGETAQENALIKASTYSVELGRPVLAMDNALEFDSVRFPPEKQPNTHVRRIPGSDSCPTDEEIISYYANLITEYGDDLGLIPAIWHFAVCIATRDSRTFETIIYSPRVFAATPCESRIRDYPLESLQIDPENGQYLAEMNPDEQEAFWQRHIGQHLTKFIRETIDQL